jgi:curli biogenesis system outer membrane secretion channel CsgG
LRLGRIIGAEQMVFGAFQMVGAVQRVDLRLVDVSTGRILRTASGTAGAADLNGWLQATDQAAAELLK